MNRFSGCQTNRVSIATNHPATNQPIINLIHAEFALIEPPRTHNQYGIRCDVIYGYRHSPVETTQRAPGYAKVVFKPSFNRRSRCPCDGRNQYRGPIASLRHTQSAQPLLAGLPGFERHHKARIVRERQLSSENLFSYGGLSPRGSEMTEPAIRRDLTTLYLCRGPGQIR